MAAWQRVLGIDAQPLASIVLILAGAAHGWKLPGNQWARKCFGVFYPDRLPGASRMEKSLGGPQTKPEKSQESYNFKPAAGQVVKKCFCYCHMAMPFQLVNSIYNPSPSNCLPVVTVAFNFFFFLFAFSRAASHGIWRFPGEGSNWSCSRRPTPQPQQCGIQDVSATYTTAHGNTGSLTH